MKRWKTLAIALAVVAVAGYGAIVAYMYVNQRALQYDGSGDVIPLADAGIPGAEAVAIPVGTDGAVVNGWYAPPRAGNPIILYYKGNAGSFSDEHERYAAFVQAGYGFLAFDYRGFPASAGEISETGILEDAVAAYEWVAEANAPIVIWGRSLGSGPASYVASIKDADAVLLETPFMSAVGVAAERFPFLPVAWVMLDQFRNDQWILDIEEPVFVAHGTADVTIAVSNGERLYELVPNKAGLWIEPGAGHGDLWAAGIWDRAQDFFSTAR